jgi:hypothetical protein
MSCLSSDYLDDCKCESYSINKLPLVRRLLCFESGNRSWCASSLIALIDRSRRPFLTYYYIIEYH